MKMVLTLDGLWGCVDGTDTDTTKDGRALAKICLSCEPHLYQIVRNATTARDAWKSLSDTFEDKGLYRRVLLLRKLHRVEYGHFAGMSDYIEGVLKLVTQLADIGKVIDDAETAEILLSGLPEEFNILVSSLEAANLSGTLSSEVVRTRLLQEDHRRSQSNTTDNLAFMANRKKKSNNNLCTYCQKKGHSASRCFKKKREEARKTGQEHTMFASAYSATHSNEYVLDSGASSHMAGDLSLLHETKSKKCVITVANGQQLNSEVIGKTFISPELTLNNVLYVPNLAKNLMSVSEITKNGYVVVFSNNYCNIYSSCQITGNKVLTINKQDGLYKLKVDEQTRPDLQLGNSMSLHGQGSMSANAADAVPYSIMHKRLGHLNKQGMSVLGGGNKCSVVFQAEDGIPAQCIACLTGKMCETSFPRSSAGRAANLLDLVHSDIAGPVHVPSWGGARYLLTFTDDKSRRTFGYLLKNKSEVSSHFVNFKTLVENQTGLRIKVLRTDQGTEYCNKTLSDYLKKAGIIHQTTCPYSPSQNGVSERANRTIFEKARAMLQDSQLPDRYWGEAVMTAIYLKNRSPTSALSGGIPECEWTGSDKLDLSHLRVFGCVAYSHVPNQKRRKLDAKAKQHIFVGYGETCKGYRLIDPVNPRRVIYSRSVVFLEDKFIGNNLLHANAEAKRANFIIFDNLINDNLKNDNRGNNTCCNNILNNNCDISVGNNDCDNNLNPLNSHEDHVNYNSPNRDSITVSEKAASTPVQSPLSELYRTTEDATEDSGEAVVLSSPVTSPLQPSASSDYEPMLAEVEESAVPTNFRPVRSTRGIFPERYNDFHIDSLMATASSSQEPLTFRDAMNSPEKDEWYGAMEVELGSMVKNNVWELVDRPKNVNIVKNKWVFKKKYDSTGNLNRYKARLVACGYSQKEGIDYSDTYSPVVRHSTLRILFAIANQLDLCMDHIDVTTAFLNGELTEKIYMEQPTGFQSNNNKVCLLKKCIYGLKQASRMWNIKIHTLLAKNGFLQSKCEPCVYVKKNETEYIIIALFVDDFYVFHNNCIETVTSLLKQHFEIRHLGTLKNCLGMNVTKYNNVTVLDQHDYIKRLLERYNMSECKPVSTPLPVNYKLEKSNKHLDDNVYQYRQLLGSLMFLSVCTRPDISYACSQLSQFSTCFDESHWRTAKRVLRYLAGTINYGLYFEKDKNFEINAFADADWANDITDRKSYTGFVVKLGNCVINWEARKQRCVALSSTESEFLCISDVCKDICFIKNFLSEIIDKQFNVNVFNDNQSAQKLLLVKEYSHRKTKHIDLRYHFVKDLIHEGNISVKYLCTDEMIADVLTKPLCVQKHLKFVKGLKLKCITENSHP